MNLRQLISMTKERWKFHSQPWNSYGIMPPGHKRSWKVISWPAADRSLGSSWTTTAMSPSTTWNLLKDLERDWSIWRNAGSSGMHWLVTRSIAKNRIGAIRVIWKSIISRSWSFARLWSHNLSDSRAGFRAVFAQQIDHDDGLLIIFIGWIHLWHLDVLIFLISLLIRERSQGHAGLPSQITIALISGKIVFEWSESVIRSVT